MDTQKVLAYAKILLKDVEEKLGKETDTWKNLNQQIIELEKVEQDEQANS